MIDVTEEINAIRRTVGTRTLEAGEARVITVSRSYATTLDDLWDACTNADRFPRGFLPVSGVLRVADALDMEHGRSRVSLETHLPNIHSLSAAAIDEVRIVPGEERTIRIEVEMNNSAGVFQVDDLLAAKLRGSGLEEHIEVIARIEAEHEKRLLTVYRI